MFYRRTTEQIEAASEGNRWRRDRLQKRKRHHRAGLQPKNPLWESSPESHVFIDFKKAFDMIWHAALWTTMKKHIGANLIGVIKHLFDRVTSAVRFNGGIGDWFRTTVRVRQRCLLTHLLQRISWRDHDRHPRRSQKHFQHWRQNSHRFLLCW